MSKKILSILTALAVAAASLAFSLTASASSQQLILNQQTTAIMSGPYDLEWFYYTPDQSGIYSFLSYNVPACEAYLFVRESDPDTGEKKYVQLAYSKNDPNYTANGHNQLQFCLTYHLEKGTTYFFAAGWLLPTQTYSQMNVKLRCDSYDENAIERIEASCPVEYNVYTDGNWVTGADGKSYFRYNLSKIIQNTRVTVYYTNGTSSTVYGKDNIDGCSIIFNDNQNEQHWFPESNPEYTANTVTVRVLNKETQMEIKVVTGALYFVKGKVVNMAGDPVKDAVVAIGDSRLDTTDADGSFSFYMSSGQYTLTLSGTNAIKRSIPIVISTDNNENNYLDTPFKLCTCDYVGDGYINAKDYAYIMKNMSGDRQTAAKKEFSAAINFTAEKYDSLAE